MEAALPIEFELRDSLSLGEQHALSEILRGTRFGALAIAWSELVRSAHPQQMSLYYVPVRLRDQLIGVAIVYVVHRFDIGKFAGGALAAISARLARWRLHPLSLRLGFVEIPLMNQPGLLLAAEHASAFDAIAAQLVQWLQGALDISGLCFKTSPERVGPASAALGALRIPAPRDALLTPRAASFRAYLSSFGRNRRRSAEKSRRRLERYGATIERLRPGEEPGDRLFALFSATAEQAARTGKLPTTIAIEAPFFHRLHTLGSDAYHVDAVCYRGEIIAFLLALHDGDTRYVKYYGGDYEHAVSTQAYFNLIAHEFEDAMDAGCKTIDCGVSNYEYKEKLGCTLHPSEYLAALYHPLLRPLAQLVGKRMARSESPAADDAP
ncbi:GNAT family N-acetyltransferase [Haliangium ochraceum]|uniref:BioF2-like acetyltransferase domain-containing protein n=1 Tax=Haliangium ochraceum (strain DSM 14365 / JCM 11303 / SMP-2) TaxID=502025 RepID=D0LXV1_HALO1|nr:GNAT family N-acetyltransferase [Haliangium ochraceum]ACY14306.1 hypothetical protein Hoch_1757 [Haliangium ochraceum DSM 14365]